MIFIGIVDKSWYLFALELQGFYALFIQLIFKSEIIRDHRNELAICGLSSVILNSIPKVTIERIHVAPIPRDLDGVAYRTLDTACGGLVLLCYRRVKYLCNAIYNVTILNREQDGSAEILVALDVCGDSFALFFTGFIALFIGVNSWCLWVSWL